MRHMCDDEPGYVLLVGLPGGFSRGSPFFFFHFIFSFASLLTNDVLPFTKNILEDTNSLLNRNTQYGSILINTSKSGTKTFLFCFFTVNNFLFVTKRS